MTNNRIQQITETIYGFICRYVEERGYAPSLKEIAAGCYLSKTTVVSHLSRLEGQGRIRREVGQPRSITILGKIDT